MNQRKMQETNSTFQAEKALKQEGPLIKGSRVLGAELNPVRPHPVAFCRWPNPSQDSESRRPAGSGSFALFLRLLYALLCPDSIVAAGCWIYRSISQFGWTTSPHTNEKPRCNAICSGAKRHRIRDIVDAVIPAFVTKLLANSFEEPATESLCLDEHAGNELDDPRPIPVNNGDASLMLQRMRIARLGK